MGLIHAAAMRCGGTRTPSVRNAWTVCTASTWWIAALVSWGIALFEYLLQVPANRIGYTSLSLAQLKILQEAITLTIFVPFAMLFMGATLKLDYVWAGLCLIGAVYFAFRS